MRQRCRWKRDSHYKYYGAIGVTVCARWDSFSNFLADMGERPEGKTLDRIDNSKGYEPSNCRWATKEEQDDNKKNATIISALGRTQTLRSWAQETGLSTHAIRSRIRRGWSVEKALTTPSKGSPRYSKGS